MKRLAALCAGAILLTGCTQATTSNDSTELTVFAAASLTESLNEIKEVYEREHPEIELVYNFDSSGTLQTQIEQGAPCDLFISAGQKQMDGLGELIQSDSRIDLLENTVVLIAPKDADIKITSFEALDQVSSIALGNADVPVGQYAEEILRNLNLWDTLNEQQKITFGSNVKEVTAQVAADAVDCGIVYRTDAASEPNVSVIAQAPNDLYSPAIYPAAILAQSAHPEEAKDFLNYLNSEQAMNTFSNVGFTRPGQD